MGVGEAVGVLGGSGVDVLTGVGGTGVWVSSNRAWLTPAAIVASTSSLVVDVSPQATRHARSASVTAAMRKGAFVMAMSLRLPSSYECGGLG